MSASMRPQKAMAVVLIAFDHELGQSATYQVALVDPKHRGELAVGLEDSARVVEGRVSDRSEVVEVDVPVTGLRQPGAGLRQLVVGLTKLLVGLLELLVLQLELYLVRRQLVDQIGGICGVDAGRKRRGIAPPQPLDVPPQPRHVPAARIPLAFAHARPPLFRPIDGQLCLVRLRLSNLFQRLAGPVVARFGSPQPGRRLAELGRAALELRLEDALGLVDHGAVLEGEDRSVDHVLSRSIGAHREQEVPAFVGLDLLLAALCFRR